MPRYRQIATGIRSEQDVRRALVAMGLHTVEIHADPVPLHDWIGRPTEVRAQVVVRRAHLGATGDDLGFVRGADGAFDALVSEIHLFRFDRRWFAEFARHAGVTLPDVAPRTFSVSAVVPADKGPLTTPSGGGASSARSAPNAPATNAVRAPAREDPAAARRSVPSSALPPVVARDASTAASPAAAVVSRARAEAASLASDLAKNQKLSSAGCVVYFLPILVWLAFTPVTGGLRNVPFLFVLMVPWTIVYVIAISIVLSRRFSRRIATFRANLPAGSEVREAALAELRTRALDAKSFAGQQAARALKELEDRGAPGVTPRPPTPPPGPGSRGR